MSRETIINQHIHHTLIPTENTKWLAKELLDKYKNFTTKIQKWNNQVRSKAQITKLMRRHITRHACLLVNVIVKPERMLLCNTFTQWQHISIKLAVLRHLKNKEEYLKGVCHLLSYNSFVFSMFWSYAARNLYRCLFFLCNYVR